MQTTVPLPLWLQLLLAEQLTVAEHERAVAAIESWVIRRMITGANTRGYGKAFVEVLQAGQSAARAADISVAAAVINSLDQGANSLAWPTDTELKEAFVQRKAYNTLTQERIRLVLGAIDQQLQRENPKTEPAISPTTSSRSSTSCPKIGDATGMTTCHPSPHSRRSPHSNATRSSTAGAT